jgi:hypothetical protein
MAITSNQRLRRHTRVEVRIRERRTVWHLVQVSILSQNVSIAANLIAGLPSTVTNALSPMLVSLEALRCH